MSSGIRECKNKTHPPDFTSCYENFCDINNICPVSEIRTSSKLGTVEFSADRMRFSDWEPFCAALKANKSLASLIIKGNYRAGSTKSPISKLDTLHSGKHSKFPGFLCKEILTKLSSAIGSCLETTTSLTKLHTEGIPFRNKDLFQIIKGLSKNKNTLTDLSFRHACFGDDGVKMLSQTVKNMPTVTHLDLTGNLLGEASANVISNLLKYQALHRHSAAWEESLRYRIPHLSNMPGLRRVTLNHNPDIGDKGAKYLADALRDDLWLRAIDLNNCGITEVGINAFLESLKLNTALMTADFRQNRSIPELKLNAIHKQLSVNCSSMHQNDFHYLPLERDPYSESDTIDKISSGTTLKKSRSGSAGTRLLKRPPFRVGVTSNWSTLQRSQSSSHLINPRTHSAASSLSHTKIRTGVSKSSSDIGSKNYKKVCLKLPQKKPPKVLSTSTSTRQTEHLKYHKSDSKQVAHQTSDCRDYCPKNNDASSDVLKDELNYWKSRVNILELELNETQEKLEAANQVKDEAEYKLIELEIKNANLTEQLSKLESDGVVNQGQIQLDDSTINTIEHSLNQFHAFIDALKAKGYNNLLGLIKYDATLNNIPNTNPITQI